MILLECQKFGLDSRNPFLLFLTLEFLLEGENWSRVIVVSFYDGNKDGYVVPIAMMRLRRIRSLDHVFFFIIML